MPIIAETTDAAASTSTTYTLLVGDEAQGQFTTSDHDWYRVNLVSGQTYSIVLTGIGTNNCTDTYLRLYDSTGSSLLASNDDGLPGLNSLITFTASSTGTYYIDAAGYGSSNTGTYAVSVTSGSLASLDYFMGAGVIDTDQSWSTPGNGATVTYGFRETSNGEQATFSQVTAAQMVAIQQILANYAEMVNITFTPVNEGGYTDNATILFADYSADDGAGAYAYYPGSTAASSDAGDVWLNTSVSTTSLPLGGYSYFAIMHELGHALGLSHPGLYNAAVGVSITYANDAQFTQDTHQYSIMSYFEESYTGANFGGYADTPMLYDIYALQQIYGANTTTRTGDTVYGFGSNAGSIYDFSINTTPAFCIWDAGGTDSIDASSYSQAQTISLVEGSFSSIGGLTTNVSIAIGAVIENAVGGSGNDTITGNSVANSLTGGAGGDTLNGGGGTDTLIGGTGSDTLNGDAGTDLAVLEFAHRVITSRSDTSIVHAAETETLSSIETYAFLDNDLAGTFQYGATHYFDITGDGHMDVVMENDAHTFYFEAGSGSGATGGLAAAVIGLQHGGPSGLIVDQVQFADVNGDGRMDSLFQGLDNRFWVNFGTASGFTGASLVAQHGGVFDPDEVTYGDVNGDSLADLIFQGLDNRFWVNFGTASGFTGASLAAEHGGPYSPDAVQFTDVNGDGRTDLVFQGVDNRFWINFGNGTGFGPAVLAAIHGGPFVAGMAKYADVNGDGNSDLIFQATDNKIWLSLSNGSTFGSNVLVGDMSTHDSFNIAAVQMADMDGDGSADLMYQGAGNEFWYYHSNGTGFDAGQLILDMTGTFAAASAGYGDLNGDGTGDIVLQGQNNEFWVSLNTYDFLRA